MEKKNVPIDIETDNLAVPELHTEEFIKEQEEIEENENKKIQEQVIYSDFVAIPEVHLHRRKK